MTDSLAEFRGRREGITIPTIWLAFALSLLIHVALLWQFVPQMKFSSPAPSEMAKSDAPAVRLATPPSRPPTPPSPALSPQPTAPLHAQPPKAILRPKSAPPSIAINRPAPAAVPSPATSSVIAPAPAPAPASSSSAGDLTSYIEAQRRARAASAPAAAPPIIVADAAPAESAEARTKRIVAANLAPSRMTFGYDPSKNGGMFVIQRTGYNDAEFMFYGWNEDRRRNIAQLIEVKRGNNSDINIAVVRQMIAIIRGQVREEDFVWESQRLGRSLTLSARVQDNAGLEEFLLHEFFYDQRPR